MHRRFRLWIRTHWIGVAVRGSALPVGGGDPTGRVRLPRAARQDDAGFRAGIARPRWFWLGLALLILVGAALRLPGYDFSLPYIDHPDEPNFYLVARFWRGEFRPSAELEYLYRGYPPAHIALQVIIQPLVEQTAAPGWAMAETIRVLRLLSIAADLATLALIGVTAWRIAGAYAGWAAAAAWTTAPLVIANNILALPDPFVPTFVMLALWLAVEAARSPRRRGWTLLSVAAGVVAILFKYPVLSAVAPGMVVALALAIGPSERRAGILLLAAQVALLAAVSLWLWFGYNFTDALYNEGAVAAESGLSNMLTPRRVLNNLAVTLDAIHSGAFLGYSALALLAALRRRARPSRRALGLVGLAALLVVTIPWLAATFSEVRLTHRLRDVLPATAAACVLLGAAVAAAARLLPARWSWAMAAPLAVLVIFPLAQASLAAQPDRLLPDRRAALRQWFDINLDPGVVLVDPDNHKTFNPIWGGVPHRRWVDWVETTDFTQFSPAEWRARRDVRYMVIPRHRVAELEATEAGRAYLGQMLHLRDFYSPPPARGPEMAFYRLWRMQVETDVRFGDAICLIGYDISEQRVEPGRSVALRFYWTASAPPDDNYQLFVHLTPPTDEQVLSQADGSPGVPERPTLTWTDAHETLISGAFALPIPADLRPGTYRVRIGLYRLDGAGWARLPVNGGPADAWDLVELTIVDRATLEASEDAP